MDTKFYEHLHALIQEFMGKQDEHAVKIQKVFIERQDKFN